MTKSSNLKESKLARYTAAAGAVVAGTAANAQITYVDINPDVVADSLNPYELDMNNDATPDIAFAVAHLERATSSFTYKGACAYVFPFNGQFVLDTTGAVTAAALNCGVPVSQASVFADFGSASSSIIGYAGLINGSIPFSSSDTPFLGANDKYLGVKFTVGTAPATTTHYGWARLSVAADATTITIKEYAYNATPNAAINTCQTAGIENVSVEDKVTIKPMLDEALINVTPDLVGGTMLITNVAGQEVKTAIINDLNAKISYEGLNTGIYFVTARFESGSVNKKIYVK